VHIPKIGSPNVGVQLSERQSIVADASFVLVLQQEFRCRSSECAVLTYAKESRLADLIDPFN
jgi:hypothetical protein